MAVLNAFITWCMCAAAGREDRKMEEMMRKKEMKKRSQEQAITKIKYASDKPKDCKYCYWWGGRNKG